MFNTQKQINRTQHAVRFHRTFKVEIYTKKETTLHKLHAMIMLEVGRRQMYNTLARYMPGNARRAKRKYIRWLAYGNASSSEEIGKIRRCLC